MDMKWNRKIPKYGNLPDLNTGNVVVGAKQLKKAVRFVYLAENADPAVTEPLETLCADNQIQITWVPTMAELGRAYGIEVGAAAAAVLNS